MGAISSVMPFIPLVREGVNIITGGVSRESSYRDAQREQQTALRQLQSTQRLNQQQAEQDAALAREKLAADSAAAENSRVAALRRAVARQRANFGSQGVSSEGGSAGAVLLGLFDESEDELAQRQKLDDIRRRSLDLGLAQRGALNTLQYSQLQERQKLGRLAAETDRAGGLVSSGLELLDTGTRLFGG